MAAAILILDGNSFTYRLDGNWCTYRLDGNSFTYRLDGNWCTYRLAFQPDTPIAVPLQLLMLALQKKRDFAERDTRKAFRGLGRTDVFRCASEDQ